MTELTIASVFWGFGFVAAIWALQTLSFPAVVFYRFLGAFLGGALIWAWQKPSLKEIRHEFDLSKSAGFWLAATLILQTWGLMTTSATKSAFITVLYVVFVPLLAAVIDKEKLSVRNTLCLSAALVGTALIVNVDFSEGFSLGDFLTLGNAFTAAFHIRIMSQLAPKSRHHFGFNTLQCLWTVIFVLPLVAIEFVQPQLFQGNWNLFAMNKEGVIGLLSLTFGSSLFAFYLQVRAQKHLNSTVAALLFLMESPFSAFFGAWLLNELLGTVQILGCILIFAACMIASLPKKLAPGAHP